MDEKKLNLIRNKIDKIDKEILNLVESRSDLAKEVINAKSGKSIFKPKREENLIKNLLSISKTARPVFIENIWRLLIAENLSLQGGLKLTIGPSESVFKTTIWHFGKGVKFDVFKSDEEALVKLLSGNFDAAIILASNDTESFISNNKLKIEKVAESPISALHELNKVAIYKLNENV